MFDARYLVDYASDAAFAIDDDLKIAAWNYRARGLLGYTAREVIGRRCSEVLQAVLLDGQPLCVPGCHASRCFSQFQPFSAPACLVRGKDDGWVRVTVASIVMSKQIQNADTRSGIAVIFLRDDREEEKEERRAPETLLQIFTLGRFGLAAGGRSLRVEKWQRKQALILLKILVAHLGQAVPRAVLVDRLWPDADERSGLERLKVTVYFLRRQLRVAGISEVIVETAGEAYVLRREAVWVDAQAFERCIAEGSAYQDRERWGEALDRYGEAQRLYRGDYLSQDVYADWCAEERERLREVHLETSIGMADCYAELGRYSDAVSVCRTVLVDDPCRESVHRALMTYLVHIGHMDSAVAQYRHCQRILADEIGVEPMLETQRLFRQIIAQEPKAAMANIDWAAG